MAYVIAQPCIGVKDNSCVEVCPVDCIHSTDDADQYFINPDECIDCGVCAEVCPVEAIFFEDDLPGAVGIIHARQRRILQEPLAYSSRNVAPWRLRMRFALAHSCRVGVPVNGEIPDSGLPISAARISGLRFSPYVWQSGNGHRRVCD